MQMLSISYAVNVNQIITKDLPLAVLVTENITYEVAVL